MTKVTIDLDGKEYEMEELRQPRVDVLDRLQYVFQDMFMYRTQSTEDVWSRFQGLRLMFDMRARIAEPILNIGRDAWRVNILGLLYWHANTETGYFGTNKHVLFNQVFGPRGSNASGVVAMHEDTPERVANAVSEWLGIDYPSPALDLFNGCIADGVHVNDEELSPIEVGTVFGLLAQCCRDGMRLTPKTVRHGWLWMLSQNAPIDIDDQEYVDRVIEYTVRENGEYV